MQFVLGASRVLATASETGLLAYLTGTGSSALRLSRWSWDGKRLGDVGAPDLYATLSVGPGGRQAAVSVVDPKTAATDLWLVDLARGVRTRLTSTPEAESSPILAPDGRTVYFARPVPPGRNVLWKMAAREGAPVERVDEAIAATGPRVPMAISPDGRFLLYSFTDIPRKTVLDIWVLPLDGSGPPRPFVESPANSFSPRFSPDGKWVSYMSEISGQMEIYVAPFPGPGTPVRVSTNGGSFAVWHPSGRRLVWDGGNVLLTATVEPRGSDIVVGRPETLAAADVVDIGQGFDAGPDGIYALMSDARSESRLQLLTNWPSSLR